MKNLDKKRKKIKLKNEKLKKKVKNTKKGKKKSRNWLGEHKNTIIICLIILAIIFFSGTKIFLYLNFILGNDIIIHLDSEKEELNLIRNQEGSVSFRAGITTNPFCKAECAYVFEDISNNMTVDYDKFKLSPGMPITKEYVIKIDDFGEGQKLYRFQLECIGSASFLCSTKNESTSRSILVTVEYNLSEDERKLKNDLKNNLADLKQRIAELANKENEIELVINDLNNHVSIDETKNKFDDLEKNVSRLVEDLNILRKVWESQDYYELNEKFDEVKKESVKTEDMIIKIGRNVSDSALIYNNLAKELNGTREKLREIKESFILNEDIALEINDNINVLNSVIESFNSRNDIIKKRTDVNSINYSVYEMYDTINDYEIREFLERTVEVDMNYEILCMLNKSCVERPSIGERANQTNFELQNVCDEIGYLRNVYLNISINHTNQSTEGIIAMKKDIARRYLSEIPEDGYNSEIIKDILLGYVNDSAEETYNLSSDEIFIQLVKDQPESCKKLNVTYENISNEKIRLIEKQETMPVEISIEFHEPELKCCVFGECYPCCVTEECINDPSKFPVVFVHGHSVNENTAADYSLDAFNKLQKEFEKDGYLNAGSINIYTPAGTSSGVWSLSPVPVSIKASYYFDVFKEPENYVVVQMKSENIDTYALRLGEIIKTVKYKTGKPKVILIAHSMGGLVSRRYLQIFGVNDVEKLIMIGTPNKGIEGSITSLCPVIGSELACRDMQKNSLFINKLNSEELPDIPLYNIIGQGCPLNGEPADGTVHVKNVMLEGENVKNFIVNGTCEGIKKLHSKMLDPKIHPEVYDIIITALRE